MTAPRIGDPCLDLPVRAPLEAADRVRVVELVASGSNGGAQEHVASLLSHVDRARYDVRLVSLSDGSAVRRWRALGIPVEIIDGSDEAATDALATRLEAWRTQIVHAHMYRADIVGTRASLRLQERRLPRPYLISTVHSSRVRSVEDRDIVRALTPSMDRVVAVSRSIIAKLEREGRQGAPIELIYNGVDLARYDQQEACCTLPEEYGFEAGTPLVGVVARLEAEKGHRTLLDAWPAVLEAVPRARLLIVGEGSLSDELKAQADSLGLLGELCDADSCVGTRQARPGARVVFTGRRDDVPAVTAALDVAVLPSYREAQGLVILEAMALSRPVVATNVGGIPEMIEDGVTGLLVPPHEPAALAAAIVRLLVDHPFADTIARAGHDLVHERFCVELMVAAIQDLYDDGLAAWQERDRTRVPSSAAPAAWATAPSTAARARAAGSLGVR
jgi:glycosyltransferase involved in cell wall biosynthesis